MLIQQPVKNFILIIIAAYIFPNTAFSENLKHKENSQQVMVKIRAVKASDPILASEEKAKPLDVDKRVSDLSSKLSGFEFHTFKMISEQNLLLPVKKKTSINLTEKTVLNIRPFYTEDKNGGDKRVGLWIKWMDSSGQRTLLDTRMHFDSNETIVAGTNCKNDKALIMAISAVPEGVHPAGTVSGSTEEQ